MITDYKAYEIYRSQTLLTELREEYEKTFNEELKTTCENCIADGLFRLKYHLRSQKNKKMEEKKESKFRLREGQLLRIPSWHMHLSNENLTDEYAIKLLKINKSLISKFAKYPDNLDELLGVSSKPVKKAAPKLEDTPTLEELLKLTRAQLVVRVGKYKSKITYKDNATKPEIAKAYIDRIILDSE